MKVNLRKSIIYSLLVALLLAVVVLVFFLRAGTTAEIKAGPVVLSQCTSCHADIDSFHNPNLIFDHWVHFKRGVTCATCHTSFGHAGGKTVIPSMNVCYSCHALQHSSQGIAAKQGCKICHPANFNRVPPDHTPAFVNKDHSIPAKGDLNNCMMCHSRSQCETCHRKKGLKINHDTYFYRNVIPKPTLSVLPKLDLGGLVALSQCTACHGDIDANVPPGLKFDHWIHFQKGVVCATCHKKPIHQPGKTNRPTMNFCFSCHGLGHSKQGPVATGQCSACHTPGFELRPPTHFSSKWNTTRHRPYVKKSLFECLTCHQKSFCQDCHMTRRVRPKGAIPPNKQKSRHEKAHFQATQDCSICHNDTFCNRCHKTPVPHSYTWLGDHRKQKPLNKNDCYICHKKLSFCNSCHHTTVAILTANNCLKCHKTINDPVKKVMDEGNRLVAQRNSFPIGDPRRLPLITAAGKLRAGVWHKVHFKKKYDCGKCHLPELARLKSQTFELCKTRGCHPPGQKKPPSGDALCAVCHPKRHQPVIPR